MKNIVLFVFLLSLLWSQNFIRDVSKVGTTSGAILDMPVSARSLALGNAASGIATDASVQNWNPASLALIRDSRLSISYIPWFAGTQLQHFSAAFPSGRKFTIGAYITSWTMEDMAVRTEYEQSGTGEYFDAGDLIAAIAFGRSLTDKFSIGFSIKYIQERIWHSVAKGGAVDFGTLYQTDNFGGLTLIAVLTNYGTDMKMSGRDQNIYYDPDPNAEGNNGSIPSTYAMDWWSLPLNFRFGLRSKFIDHNNFSLTCEVDALHPSNNYESLNIGVETVLLNTAFIRFGYSSLFQKDSIEGISIGAGVKIPSYFGVLTFDYGYRDYGHLGYIQALTLNISP
ncbi:MAG: PorV/PorQ family protein [FCB group bacterium]|nr:PorV/PorQ family protein [FCB group bacterium]